MDTKWNATGSEPGGETEYFVAGPAPETAEEPAPSPRRGTAVKAVAGFLAFFLGLSLILGSLGAMAGRMIAQRGAPLEWSGDWQETQEFRDQVSAYLREFLSLGATGTAGNDWYATQEAVVMAGDYYRSVYFEALPSEEPVADTGIGEVPDEAPNEAPDAGYQADKNVLYFITKNNQLLYTNTEENTSSRFFDRDYEGYNFYLTCRDGRTTAFKDGAALDLYGGGIYESGSSQWFVPGYENLQAGDWLDGVAVCMAVREEPVRYWTQDADGSRYYYGRMYQVSQRQAETRQFYLRRAVLLAAGTVLLCVWLALRKEKRLADEKIASWTGYVWTEVWIALALVPLAWLLVSRSWQELYWACREMWWRWDSVYLGQLVYGAASFLLSGLPGLLALGWVLWLVRNHCRYNPKERRKSLFRVLPRLAGSSLRKLERGLRVLFQTLWRGLRTLRAADLKRPVEKRLTRTIAVGTAALAVVLAALALLLAEFLPNFFWYEASWKIFTLALAALAAGTLALLVLSIWSLRLGRDLGRLNDQVEAIRSGDLTSPLDLPQDADLRETAEALNDIQAGMKTALAEQTRSERMKVELISNVSHDLKTPLTSILSYTELLRQEELPPAAADYARIIDEKAQRLKGMVQDVFEVSKAASDQLPVNLERLDLAKLLRQTLADMDDPIQKSALTFKTDLPAEPVMIVADGKRLYRVFQNLIDNALRYALEGSRVYLTLKTGEGRAETSVRNTSRNELPEGVDFTARFVRGDESRTDGGSGLGLSIARSFTEACGGTFRVETLADLFTAVVTLPLAEKEETA